MQPLEETEFQGVYLVCSMNTIMLRQICIFAIENMPYTLQPVSPVADQVLATRTAVWNSGVLLGLADGKVCRRRPPDAYRHHETERVLLDAAIPAPQARIPGKIRGHRSCNDDRLSSKFVSMGCRIALQDQNSSVSSGPLLFAEIRIQSEQGMKLRDILQRYQ